MFSRVPTWHNKRMKQTDLHLDLSIRRTRKRVFLNEMERVVPWIEFVALIAPHAPTKATGRRPFPVEAMLRIHFFQQWFGLSDVAMEEALYDVPLYREFAGLGGMSRLPDRVSILRFRHLLEQHQLAEQFLTTVNAQLSARGCLLKEGTAVDATLIAAPSSTKNKGGERDPEMHQTKKGNMWHFGMKAHIGVDADSGLVHTVVGTAGQRCRASPCVGARRGNPNIRRCGFIRAWKSARRRKTSRPTGTLRCARASVAHWTRIPRWASCEMKLNGPRPAFAPKSNTRLQRVIDGIITVTCNPSTYKNLDRLSNLAMAGSTVRRSGRLA